MTLDRVRGIDPETRIIDEERQVGLAQRDARAFAPLYARYAELVYRYCWRRLGDPEAAADATSLVFTKALTALPRYRAGSFRSWLFAIAHNTVTDDLRGSRRVDDLAHATLAIDPGPSPEEIALRGEAGREVRNALRHLSDDQRHVVELRLAGLSDREIADVLGRSLPAIRMLQVRAAARLRVVLGHRFDQDGAPDGRR